MFTGALFCENMVSMKKTLTLIFSLLLALCMVPLSACNLGDAEGGEALNIDAAASSDDVLAQIPAFTGSTYTTLNDVPNFTDEELASDDFISLSELDSLGRCGVAFGVICEHTMPNQDSESRGDISEIHPSGWKQAKYDSIKDDRDSDGHLYERSHLLGWALTGLNDEPRNLITGTHYFNGTGMLQFENQIARYVERKGGRVLYRVTPMFAGNNLVATGVRMEAYSLDDYGESVCFDVFIYNVQPGIKIDYATGASEEDDAPIDGDAVAVAEASSASEGSASSEVTYVLNTKSHKFHSVDCEGIADISSENREETTLSRAALIDEGYTPSGDCNP